MNRFVLAAALLCAPLAASAETNPNNFLAGVRSINVVMHRDRVPRLTARRHLVFSVRHDGKVWRDKVDAIALPYADCVKYAGDYGDRVSAGCYRPKEFRALHSSIRTVGETRQRGKD